ncbi:uncharacterized protein LAJ45_04737 [Morchella importuna]|uniref:uncharacterized protein n=1 Tax=Morchella importuna TaxID=1174673 RepID=UPI001E8DA7E7|nr:uncharacterized protein LAJ45_04737 [Morchella importuna]KAH8151036.1 hypothetical protein LAJ45_04737 [Morchella importuna]
MNSLNALAHLALLATGALAYPTSNYSPAAAVGLLKRATGTVGKNQTSGNGGYGNGNGPNLNTPSDRGAWLKDYDINTDWYNEWPNTGVVREYWLSVENSTFAPDGYDRLMLTFNGSYPGPTIVADWGDTVRIHVKNNMEFNGTSIHWHGLRQLWTTEQDGVNGITQCPIAPTDSFTYEWTATQYGTSWYHSHFSLQYAEGVAGAIVINGPTSANYDVDLGPVTLTDWYHATAFSEWHVAQTSGPPAAQNGLINGTNVFDCTGSTDTACVGGGKRFEFPAFEYGKKYKLRLINTSTDTHFRVSLDGHSLTVVAADFVPITPFTTDFLSIGIGQRYDVIIEANAPADNYWFRATIQTTCSAANTMALDVKGIVRYSTATTSGDPTTSAGTMTDSCLDEPLESLVPVVAKPVTESDLSTAQDVEVSIAITTVFKWTLNGISADIDWASPTLLKLLDGESYPTDYHVLDLPTANQMYYLVIETTLGITHPIHLHGHDFYILAQGTGAFNETSTPVNWANPMRRDVAMLPASGHLIIAFETDNPGIWLMHCHIAWHVSGGFALQFVERSADILANITIDNTWHDTCTNWNTYDASGIDPPKDDSGLRKMMF